MTTHTVQIEAASVSNAIATAQRHFNISHVPPKIISGDEGLYRLTFPDNKVAEVTIIYRTKTHVIGERRE